MFTWKTSCLSISYCFSLLMATVSGTYILLVSSTIFGTHRKLFMCSHSCVKSERMICVSDYVLLAKMRVNRPDLTLLCE